MADLIRGEIHARIDTETWNALAAKERTERDMLLRVKDRWEDIARIVGSNGEAE